MTTDKDTTVTENVESTEEKPNPWFERKKRNKQKFLSREELREKIKNDPTPRTTISFYRYVIIENPAELREKMLVEWAKLGVLGRIYIAREGINSQMSVPTEKYDEFIAWLDSDERFVKMPIKIAVEDDGKSFYKLTIKVRKKIVADGLDDDSFDVTNVGKHLTAKEFNECMEKDGTIVVDMRNHYESEIGKFEGAIAPDVDTFREELPVVVDLLKDKKDKKILLYCTGGVRCEKASAYFKSEGFEDVNQLLGGVIDYARQCEAEGLEPKFKGKNFVFDERLGERITDDILSECHQCGAKCDTHTNCKNDDCHLLFIQCSACNEKMEGCCTIKCKEIVALPVEEQRKLRKTGQKKEDAQSVYKSRLRPNLKEMLQTGDAA